jgi:dipeptidyl-peptidase-4
MQYVSFTSHRNLGTVEIQDQLSATRTLLQSYEFLDKNRTAIWGWSHGGFATLMTLAQDIFDPVFSCGIAGAIYLTLILTAS